MYALYYGCSEEIGGCPPSVNWTAVVQTLTNWTWWKSLWDAEATVLYLAWYSYLVVAWYVLPGKWVEGLPLRDGTRKRYKVSGEFVIPAQIELAFASLTSGLPKICS